jgi:uncharacterized protein (DUF305 family)
MREQARSPRLATGAIIASLVTSVGVAGCGTDREGPSDAGRGSGEERAFLAAMVEHHVVGAEMARLAQRRGDAPVILRLAGSIIETYEREILAMDEMHRRLFGVEFVPDDGAPARLGLSPQEAALDDAEAFATLERARLFDLAFLDAMVAHHRGAIALAEATLRAGADPALRLLAESTVDARGDEVEAMSEFRAARFGEPTPASGRRVPTRATSGTTGAES